MTELMTTMGGLAATGTMLPETRRGRSEPMGALARRSNGMPSSAAKACCRPVSLTESTLRPDPGHLRSLSQLWVNALDEETHLVAPVERMVTAIVTVASAASLALALGTTFQLLANWGGFVAFAQRLLA